MPADDHLSFTAVGRTCLFALINLLLIYVAVDSMPSQDYSLVFG